ncbi:sulfotransferase [Microbaculum marinum]|uniref:Sulfotransferase n=1 Tax=Microbaculum marinum TaxID=1764581 RepID=A0AAW9S2X3_9HYPH
MADAAPRFVVVLGPARSGTTLLRDLIAAHPAVAGVPFDVNHIWRTGNEAHPDDAFPAEAARPEPARRIRERLTALAMRNAGSSPVSGARWIAEKTVGNALRPDFVDRVLPDATYVRIVRDPRHTIPSSIAAWKAPQDLGYLARKARYFDARDIGYMAWYGMNAVAGRLRHGRGVKVWGARYPGIQDDLALYSLETVCARQWLAAIGSIDRFFGALPADRGISLRYEDLTSGPESLAQVWSFLGVADDALARTVFSGRVREATGRTSALPDAITGDTRAAVEAKMAELGYV